MATEPKDKASNNKEIRNIMQIQYAIFDEMTKNQMKALKGIKLLIDPPNVEVGTTRSEEVFSKNRMRLLHYIPTTEIKYKTPLLFVYAVINRPYILDLQPDKSVVKKFVDAGFDVYMIDWGYPSMGDEHIGTTEYIEYYIHSAVKHIQERTHSKKISVLGYCIGGYFTTIYSAVHPENIANLMVMAAPLYFDIDQGLLHIWTKDKNFDPQKVVEVFGSAPADFLNGGFAMLDPLPNTIMKYYGLFQGLDNDEFVMNFLRMEKWIKDGIAIPGKFYAEFIKGGYQENRLFNGKLAVADKIVNLSNIDMPVLIIVGKSDHLVPMASTKPLYDRVSSEVKEIIEYPTGHIGLSVSGRSHREVWPKAVDWLVKNTVASQGQPRPTRPKKR
jgi:polyhydroxyalkanoate synthase